MLLPIALSFVEGCAQSIAGLWRMAYSVWFQRYAISYQPYANYMRLASEIFLSSLQIEFLSNLLVLRSLRHWNRRSMNYKILTLPNILSAC